MWIYLDNNATTRVAPEVLSAMLPFFTEKWGNPSSLHRFGSETRTAVDRARQQVATLLGANRPTEIIFTSGGTESNHLAIRGTLNGQPDKKHLITTPVEHSSVLALCKTLEKEGYEISLLPVDSQGALDIQQLEAMIRPTTALVTCLWANNETGVLFPIEKMAQICAARGVPLHVDAIQACGKLPIDLAHTPVTLLSLSAHKFHGPKGMGALYVRRGTGLRPIFVGGSQERSLRAGTENVPGIVGLGMAAELASQQMKEQMPRVAQLRDRLETMLLAQFSFARRNGPLQPRLPNTSSLSFVGLDGEAICLLLSEQGIAASTGSACSSGTLESSHVLTAMGLTPQQAKGTVRISLSRETTSEEIDRFLAILPPLVARLQRTSPIRHHEQQPAKVTP